MRYLLLLIFCNFSLLAQMPSYKLICESMSDQKYLSTILKEAFGEADYTCAKALQILQKEGFWLAQCHIEDSVLVLKTKQTIR